MRAKPRKRVRSLAVRAAHRVGSPRPPKHERVLRFNCSDPCVRDEFEAAAHGTDLACAISDLDNWLRGQIKYADRHELQDARDKLWEFVHGRGCEAVMEVW